MTQDEKAEFAATVFKAVVSENQDRLQRGRMLRQAIHDAIKRGETPTGYRVDWIRKSAQRMVETAYDIIEEFDETHPNDKASTMDILDILATTVALFKKHAS